MAERAHETVGHALYFNNTLPEETHLRTRSGIAYATTFFVTMMSLSAPAAAQEFPSRPLRMVVPFAPGGPTDLSARMVATKLGEVLGQNVVVDNRPGAGGSVGTQLVVNSKPDGYTILLCSSSVLVLNPLLTPGLPYSPLRDLMPLSTVTSSPFVLLVNPSFEAKSVQALIAMAKAQPGKLTFASGGVGTGGHLAGEMFRSMAGIQITHVPFKGSGPAAIDLIGGHVHMAFESISSSLGNITGGRLTPLAVTTRERSAVLPKVPTIIESGVSGYEVSGWQGICAPRGTPQPVVAVLNRGIVSAMKDTDIANRFTKLGVDPISSTPSEFVAFVKSETERWAKPIAEIGAQAR